MNVLQKSGLSAWLHSRSVMWVAVACGFLALGQSAAMAESKITDQAGFFSPAVRTEALNQLKAIEAKTGFETKIETFATLPEPWQGQLDKGAKKSDVFIDLTKDRGQQANAKGLFVVIVKNPSHLEVVADRRLREAGFSATKRGKVAETLLAGFRQKDYDEALTSTVKTIQQEFNGLSRPSSVAPGQNQRNMAPNHAPLRHEGQRGNGWGGVLLIIGVVLAVLFGFALIRALFGGGGSGVGQPGMGTGGGGMGFMGSLLTGMFGAMAGHYLYDSFFNNSHGQAWGNDSHSSGDELNRNDTSGGDFGDSSNFSGGDWGGGGGDWGGGGGDSFGGDF